MEKSGQAGIATFVMRGKEYLVAIFAENGILRAETMRFSDELRSPQEIGLPKKPAVPPATLKKFEKLIATKAKKRLSFTEFKDEQSERLLKLVKRKSAQRKNVVEIEGQENGEARAIDLLEVLKKSLGGKGK
jgi:DNA end-binding protein Ku